MVPEDNASNRPRKINPKKSTRTLVGAWLGQHEEKIAGQPFDVLAQVFIVFRSACSASYHLRASHIPVW